jgi:hypothetical protein
MGRPKGAKNRRTLLREAEATLGRTRDPNETVATHFFLRAKMGKCAGRSQSKVDADYEKAAHLAALAAPYRHAKLNAVKLTGDPNNPMRIRDDATADELRAEIMKHLKVLGEGGTIDPEELSTPKRRTVN